LSSFAAAPDAALIGHCRAIAEVIPIIGFYMQTSVGGRALSYRFWREFVEIENVAAIKIAPFDRYKTLDVVRAVSESGRSIPLYTGNDDNIVMDLLTPYSVELFCECRKVACKIESVPNTLHRKSVEVTDANAAFFDAANKFAGCNAGLLEVLRRQGLLEGIWCLDPAETLSPGQKEEIDRVYAAYPHLNDDDFVRQGLDKWLTA
jgi:hypothetical protein